tara:strand:+ start:48 stop:386 length:339 start_codon:yes stop_codon:yes gene_type:complete
MNYFLKFNKSLLTYSFIIILVIPILGINFLSFIGNILLLIFLIPVLLLLIIFIGISSYKSKIKKCNNCGAISLDSNETCTICGANLSENSNKNKIHKKPSESIIEIKAEVIK